MTFYLDTSLLVAALTAEADGARVEAWLRLQTARDLVVSDWVVTEFSAALSIKLRTGQLDAAQRTMALAEFSRFCDGGAAVLPVERRHFRTAALFSDQYAVGLRGGDALHLAVAFEYGAMLCTLDRRLCEAGPDLGVQTFTVGGLFP